MLFNRLSSLRDDQDRREAIYAKNLPRNFRRLAVGCERLLHGIG